jgi:hypothetical protein
MLKISQMLKNIFRKIFFLLFVVECLILGIILILYYKNIDTLTPNIKQLTEDEFISNKNLLEKYINDKLLRYSEDLLLIMKTYEDIEMEILSNNNNFVSDYDNSYINIHCSQHGKFIPNNNSTTLNWFFDTDINTETRMKGTWFINNNIYDLALLTSEDQKKIKILCLMNPILTNLIKKNLLWKDVYPVNYDYFFFAFSDNLVFKFPTYYNKYMSEYNVPTTACQTDPTTYMVKCRPFYYQTLRVNENIYVNPPYIAASTGLFNSDLCIKSFGQENINGINYPKLVLCLTYNFNEFLSYTEQLKVIVNDKYIGLYLIHYFNNKLNVFVSSDYTQDKYISYSKQLNVTPQYETNEFFERFVNKILDQYTNKHKNDTDYLDNIKNYYSQLNNYYLEELQPQINNIINIFESGKNYTDIISKGLFQFDQQSHWKYEDGIIHQVNNPIQFFILPINVGLQYDNDYIISQTDKNKVYMLFISEIQNLQNIEYFLFVLILQFILYFCLMTLVNLVIWVFFEIIFHLIFRGFLYPLKEISMQFDDIYFSDFKDFDKTDIVNHPNDKDTSQYKSKLAHLNNISNVVEDKIVLIIQNFVRLGEYQEIYDCFLTLKIVKIINTYSSFSTKDTGLNFNLSDRDAKIENIVDVLFYLMFNFGDDLVQDVNIDAKLICETFYNNFLYKLNFHIDEEEIDLLFIDIIKIFENLSGIKYSYITRRHGPHRASKRVKHAHTVDEKSYYEGLEQENKKIFNELKEKIQFKYTMYKMKHLEYKFHHNEKKSEDIIEKKFDSSIGYVDSDNQIEDEEYRKSLSQKEKSDEMKVIIADLLGDFNKYFVYLENHSTINSLKKIATMIIKSGLLIDINQETEAISECIKALRNIQKLQEDIIYMGNLTKFAFLSISSLFYEKILYYFSELSERYDQRRTQLYIYLNMLDLAPVYDRDIRVKYLQKLLDYLNNTSIQQIKTSKNAFLEFFKESNFINVKLVRHKTRAIFNMTKKYPKNVVIMIDLNFSFIKDSYFQEIIKYAVFKENHFFNFALFDDKNLYVYSDLKYDDPDIINLCKFNTEGEFVEDETHPYVKIFDFINNYSNIDNINNIKSAHRLDVNLIKCLNCYQFKEYPKNNNFIIIFTTIDSEFDFTPENLVKLSGTLYEGEYSLILCVLYDYRLYQEERYIRKLSSYKKFIEEQIINGQLIIMYSFSLVKTILKLISPLTLKEFNMIKMRSYLNSFDV